MAFKRARWARRKTIGLGRLALGAVAALTVGEAARAADSPWSLGVSYTVDVSGPVAGGRSQGGRVLDNLMVEADLDLGQAAGWRGATAHLSLLSNAGGQPNDLAGTLQGVDNIEVARPRGKLYEAWLEQGFGAGSLRAGLYDLNSEFYASEAAGLLIAPAFGIGSELAATGPNGPSIFPSTALAARLRLSPREDVYLQAAAVNAKAGVIGDPGGVDLGFDDGALYIAEAGWTGRGKVAAGAWRYGERQPDIRDVTLAGEPARRTAQGAYLLVEQPLAGGAGGPRVSGFVRLGVSDGDTSPFRGGAQAGVLVEEVLPGRPDSAVSAGVNRGELSGKFRRNLADGGVRPARGETGFEITYADRIAPRLTLQPSLQYVLDAGGDRAARDVVVLTLRASFEL